jgi:uracil-DNA glycosylase family 4
VTPDERRRALDELANEIGRCTKCRLHESRTHAVPGEGHPETEVVFLGEGPGFNEDQQGRPFVGAAGGLLNELLKSIGWSRQEVFITNVVKCRPPGNRDPEPDEMAACRPYLRRQLEVLDPAVLVTLGRISTAATVPGARIAATHGTVRPLDPDTGAADALAYPMYHPAAAFRQPALRDTLQADIAGLPDALIESRRRRETRRTGKGAAVGETSAVTSAVTGVASVAIESAAAQPVGDAVPGQADTSPVESDLASVGSAEPADNADQLSLF